MRAPSCGGLGYAGLCLLVVATIALVGFVRLRLAGIPLERDEGEYSYAAQLILNGVPPYSLVYNMKLPGTYYAYAALMAVFGQTAWGIRMGLLAVHLGTMGLLFTLGRRLVGTLAASVGVCVFSVLALDRWSMGVFAHATHFALLAAVAGLLVLHSAMNTQRPWLFGISGVLMGLAITMKQQAFFFALLAVALSMAGAPDRKTMVRRGGLVLAGLVGLFGSLGLTLATAGVFKRFWFWAIEYASVYVTERPLSLAWTIFQQAWTQLTQETWLFWYVGLVGFVLLFAMRWSRESRTFVSAWFVASALSVTPGFYFRPHYFILLMPVVALLAGIAVASINRSLMRHIGVRWANAVVILASLSGLGFYAQSNAHYLFQMNETELFSAYAANPFLAAPEIGRYLQAHTKPDDLVAILGSEPEILFYAHRRSATGYIYTYGPMEPQPYARRMQDEMMAEIEAGRPAYLVLVGMPTSWGTQAGSDMRLPQWASAYAAKCYDRVGIGDAGPNRSVQLHWDADAADYAPFSLFVVVTLRRKGVECRAG